ncbi:ATP-binding cassette domain-containing protein [Latilactobacillus curvatus]|uniref:ATP-binding cassette domain-containing protein n=1 Tax=Latilactobacillus curvatus TaxID=28038 RepID=UPI0039AF3992
MCSEHVIEVNNIQKAFATKKVVLSVSLAVSKGEIFALLGPNVAGKTTLLKMMTTLLRPDSGTITLNGFDTISARENLRLFGRLNGLSAKASRTRANELLTDFDLNQSADQTLATFSGGMRRRLDLAVSLVGKPRILFLDEPTTGLDPRTRTQMWHAIQKLVADGSTVFLTTQYLEEVDQYADQIALIDHGQLIASGTPSELKAQVGGQQLQLTIANQQQVTQAQTICETVLQQPVRVTDQTIIGPLVHDDMADITAILNQCQLAGITISDLQLTAPSLDDVFLKMTVGKN